MTLLPHRPNQSTRLPVLFWVCAVVMLAFAAWCVALVVSVNALRDDVTQRVGWLIRLQSIQSEVQQALVGPPSAGLAPALPRVHTMVEDARAASSVSDETVRRFTEVAATFDTVVAVFNGDSDSDSDSDGNGDRDAAAGAFFDAANGLVPAIRRENALISNQLSAKFSAYNALVSATLALAAMNLYLLAVFYRRRGRLDIAARALREAGRVEAGLFAYSPIGIGVFDAEGRLVRHNPALAGIFERHGAADALPSFNLGTDPIVRRVGATDFFDAVRGGAQQGPCTFIVEPPDGRARSAVVDVIGFPIRDDDGAVTEIIASVVDVADFRRAQVRLASIGRTAANVAHEVNNPLHFAKGNVSFAREEIGEAVGAGMVSAEVAEPWLEALADAELGVDRAAAITSDLQTAARPGPGVIDGIDARAAVELAQRMAEHQITRVARLTVRLEEIPPVRADAQRLGQACLNLLVNAAHAIEPGRADENEIELALYRDPDESAARPVVIEVRDTGIGIAPDVQAQIFNPFFTTRASEDGLGLGLALCREIVREAGGEIEVESEPGSGSVFRIRLEQAGGTVHDGLRGATPTPVTGNVLVVDDDEVTARMVARILERHHRVTGFASAEAAMAHLEAGAPVDAILFDTTMRGTTGCAFCEAVIERRPQLASCIVLVAGGSFVDDIAGCSGITTHPILLKPVRPSAVRAAVAACIRGRASTG